MQQGHTYVTDDPSIPQTGDSGLSGHAPMHQQHEGAPQAGVGYAPAPVYGATPLPPQQPQKPQQPQPYFSPPPHPGAYAPQPVAGGYPGQQQLTPIYASPHAQQGAVQIQYINGQPVAVAMGMPVPNHAGGPSGAPQYGAPQYGAPQYAGPPGQPYAVHAVAMPMNGAGFLAHARAPVRPGQRGHLPPGMWSDGLCNCGDDCGSCCLACIFAPYRWAKTVSSVGLQTFNSAFALYFIPWLLGLVFYIISDFFVWAAVVAILSHVFLVFVGGAMRGRIRQNFQIAGDSCEDCCVHCCCTCCAVAQEARHVDRDLGLLAPARY